MTCHDTNYEQRKNYHSGLDDCNCKGETKYHYKDNCEEYEGGSEIVIKCPTDIKEAECVPILAQKIYDCVTAGCEHFLASDEIQFEIDCFEEEKYEDAAKICIDKVAISYDFLGADINSYDKETKMCTG